MLNFCSLYSGSTGNSLLVQTKDTNILVDARSKWKKNSKSFRKYKC